MGQNGADYSEIWVRQGPSLGEASLTSLDGAKWCRLLRDMGPPKSPRVQREGLAKRASLRTIGDWIGDWIVLEYVLGEASLTSLRWGKMVQTTPRYGSVKVPEGPT